MWFVLLDSNDAKTMITEYLEKSPDYGPRAYKCTICGKMNSDKSSASKHVENIHFPGIFTYSCKYCGKTFNARNNMYVHISQHHKGNWKWLFIIQLQYVLLCYDIYFEIDRIRIKNLKILVTYSRNQWSIIIYPLLPILNKCSPSLITSSKLLSRELWRVSWR